MYVVRTLQWKLLAQGKCQNKQDIEKMFSMNFVYKPPSFKFLFRSGKMVVTYKCMKPLKIIKLGTWTQFAIEYFDSNISELYVFNAYHVSEYWYMGSILAKSEIEKKRIEDWMATGL